MYSKAALRAGTAALEYNAAGIASMSGLPHATCEAMARAVLDAAAAVTPPHARPAHFRGLLDRIRGPRPGR